VKAGAGNEPGSYLGIFSFRFANHLQPADDSPPVGLLLSNKGHIVLALAGNQTGLARSAFVQIDDHTPERHILLPSLPLTFS
jgi:hypothetical protein